MQREDISRYDIPDTPGVYFFLGPKRGGAGRDGKDILYIGKATSLHDRVRSYFAKDLGEARSPAIVAMVGKADGLKWQECGSVLEALILEAALIKKHQPPYNVDEKDDKSWNYVVVTKEDFPRVLIVRGRELHDPVFLKTKNYQLKTVFGPFPHGGQLKEALKLVRKIFPFRDICMPASENTPQNRKASPYGFKQCFNAQIGLCPGVCSGAVTRAEYAKTIRNIIELFSGKMPSLRTRLEREMKAAAKAERFEEAAVLRTQVAALSHIRDVSLIKDESRMGSGRGYRIEAYDVAHTGGSETVGVMTVVEGGETQTAAYRKFVIREFTNNDVGALGEMLTRRLTHTEWQYPRIIVVDGGTAQMRTAKKVLTDAGVAVPLVGVVKDERHKPVRLIGDTHAIEHYNADILLANAEAHRYAIRWHRQRRGKIK